MRSSGVRDAPVIDVEDERAVQQRIDWLASRVDGLDPDRAWAWCQAMAVVLAVALLAGRGEDPAGEAMLALARAAAEGS